MNFKRLIIVIEDFYELIFQTYFGLPFKIHNKLFEYKDCYPIVFLLLIIFWLPPILIYAIGFFAIPLTFIDFIPRLLEGQENISLISSLMNPKLSGHLFFTNLSILPTTITSGFPVSFMTISIILIMLITIPLLWLWLKLSNPIR